jgi:polar amino acid transport system ATP-binding protein
MKLSIRDLSKTLGSHRVLRDVQLEPLETRALVLLGPSGGGKSTLLRILAGLETMDSGSVEIDGEPLPSREPELRDYRKRLGVVFQSFNLFPHLDALGNITLPLELVHGYSRSEATETARNLLRRFQLEKHASQKPAELSGGQRQRIAIARAIAARPRLLLLDEPTSALDPEMTFEVLEMIAELQSEGRDLLLVTHELGFARRVASHIAILANGTIVEIGTPPDILDAPQHPLTQGFLAKALRH